MTNIHNSDSIIPEVHHSNDGRGWITFKVKRKGWYDGKKMEEVEVTMFTEDIAKLACDLSEELREGISQMNDDMAEKELAV
jgi:hypothetical protein